MVKNIYSYISITSVIVFLLIVSYEYLINYFAYLGFLVFNYLEAHVPVQEISLEDCKGYVDLYYIDKSKKNKERITASYPIDIVAMYDKNDFKNISLLKTIIENRFKNCAFLSDVEMCKLLIIDEKGKFDYIRGEIFKGKYQGKPFKFMYFIQDAYGQRLDELDKF